MYSSRQTLSIVLLIITLSFFTVAGMEQPPSGEYRFPREALTDFLRPLTGQISFAKWIQEKDGSPIPNPWCYEAGKDKYVVYRYLRYWFGPGDSTWQRQAASNLLRLIADPRFAEMRPDIRVYPVTFIPNSCLKPSLITKDGNVVIELPISKLKQHADLLQQIEVDLKKFETLKFDPAKFQQDDDPHNNTAQDQAAREGRLQQTRITDIEQLYQSLLNGGFGDPRVEKDFRNLREKYNPGDKGGKSNKGKENGGDGSGGIKGPFKIGKSFSSWFVTLLEFVAEYLGIKEITEKVLLLAYMIAPDLFEQIGGFLVQLQQALTSDSLDTVLNSLTDIFRRALDIIDYINMAHELLTDPALWELAKQINLDQVIKVTAKTGMIDSDVLDKFRQFVPFTEINLKNLKSFNPEQFKNFIKDVATERFEKELSNQLRRLKIPGVVNLEGLVASLKNRTFEEWTKNKGLAFVESAIPAKYKKYQSAVTEILNGNHQQAVRQLVVDELASQIHIDAASLGKIYDGLSAGNLPQAMRDLAKTQTPRLGEYAATVNLLLDNKPREFAQGAAKIALLKSKIPAPVAEGFVQSGPAGALSAFAKMHKVNLSPQEIAALVDGTAGQELIDTAKAFLKKAQNPSRDLTRDEVFNLINEALNGYARVAGMLEPGLHLSRAELFSPSNLKNTVNLIRTIDQRLPELGSVLSWKALLGGFNQTAQDALAGMQLVDPARSVEDIFARLGRLNPNAKTTLRLEQLRSQLEQFRALLQQQRFGDAWRIIAEIQLQQLPVSYQSVAKNFLQGKAEQSLAGSGKFTARELFNRVTAMSQALAEAAPYLGSSQVWWSIPEDATEQTKEAMLEYLKKTGSVNIAKWLGNDGNIVKHEIFERASLQDSLRTTLGAFAGMDQEIAGTLLKGDAPAAFNKLLQKFARQIGITSEEALQALERGDTEGAIEKQLQTVAEVNYVGRTNYLRQVLHNRIAMMRRLLEMARLPIDPNKRDEIILLLSMVRAQQ